jgi:hypothetical protein
MKCPVVGSDAFYSGFCFLLLIFIPDDISARAALAFSTSSNRAFKAG